MVHSRAYRVYNQRRTCGNCMQSVAYYVILPWKFYGHGGSSMKPITENTLFYGDNLFILREHIPSESVDLIYHDPPPNSSRN